MKFFHFAVIALAVTCLFGIVHSIHAREIVDFPSDTTDYSYSGYIYHTAHLKTDVPFYCVWWYVDGNYAGWSNGGNTETEANFSPYWLTGSIEGVEHTITAEVGWLEDDGATHLDTDSYNITVYAPEYTSTPIDNNRDLLFLSGYVEISKQTYDYDSGYMSFDYAVSAYHSGVEADGDISITTEYKASFRELNLENKDFRHRGKIKPEDGKRYFSDSGPHGITLEFGGQGIYYEGEAYVRLVVDERIQYRAYIDKCSRNL